MSASSAEMMGFTKRLALICDLIAATIFVSLFVAIVAQTTMRYVFRSPLTLSLEFATLAFIWLTFWVASCMAVNDHIRFDVVSNMFPEQARRLFGIVTNLFFAAVFILGAPAAWDYFQFVETQRTGSMGISQQWAFGPFFIFFAVMPLKMLLNVAVLLSGSWKVRI
jgi:TRAP-type C4-dicarboxylate transport system permease small subunit